MGDAYNALFREESWRALGDKASFAALDAVAAWGASRSSAMVPVRVITSAAFRGLTRSEMLVYLLINTFANNEGLAWPSQARIAAMTGLAVDTVSRAVGVLERAGLLERVPYPGCARKIRYVVFAKQGGVAAPFACLPRDTILTPGFLALGAAEIRVFLCLRGRADFSCMITSGISQAEVGGAVGVARPHVTRAVSHLAAAGLINRGRTPGKQGLLYRFPGATPSAAWANTDVKRGHLQLDLPGTGVVPGRSSKRKGEQLSVIWECVPGQTHSKITRPPVYEIPIRYREIPWSFVAAPGHVVYGVERVPCL